MSPDISDYIDFRNELMWSEVNNTYQVRLEFHNETYYTVYTQAKNAIIFIPNGNICKDAFMHELLHIYVKVKGVYIGNILSISLAGALSDIADSTLLLDHLGNCLDHTKMLPIYLAAGFNRHKFIIDYAIPKCSPEELKVIRGLFDSKEYWPISFDRYLGKFFGMKACPNNQFEYSPLLAELKSIDPKLFGILIEFWNAWDVFDIDKVDTDYDSYREISNQFVTGLIGWITNKKSNTGN